MRHAKRGHEFKHYVHGRHMCAPAGHVGLGLVEGAVGGGVRARDHEVLRVAAADVTAGALADVRR